MINTRQACIEFKKKSKKFEKQECEEKR
jgi:hypothetical protein